MILAVKCITCGTLIEGVGRQEAVAAWRCKRPLTCLRCSPGRVYTDGIHLAAPGPEHLLHTLAGSIGLKRGWYQNNGSYPHYDLTSNKKRVMAIRQGAVRVEPRELVTIMQKAGKSLRKRPA